MGVRCRLDKQNVWFFRHYIQIQQASNLNLVIGFHARVRGDHQGLFQSWYMFRPFRFGFQLHFLSSQLVFLLYARDDGGAPARQTALGQSVEGDDKIMWQRS